MPRLLSKAPPSDEQRQENDKARPEMIVAVLGALATFAYLFGDVATRFGWPPPRRLLAPIAGALDLAFGRQGEIETELTIAMAPGTPAATALSRFLALAGVTFAATYV